MADLESSTPSLRELTMPESFNAAAEFTAIISWTEPSLPANAKDTFSKLSWGDKALMDSKFP